MTKKRLITIIIVALIIVSGLLVYFLYLNKKNDWNQTLETNDLISPVSEELKDNSSGFSFSFDYGNDFKFNYQINMTKGNGDIKFYLDDQLIYSAELTEGVNEYTSDIFSDKKGDFKCVIDYSDDAEGFEVIKLYTRTKKINKIIHR